jgi:hypothetical protein
VVASGEAGHVSHVGQDSRGEPLPYGALLLGVRQPFMVQFTRADRGVAW